MRRRDLLGVLGSAVLAWPPAARGQQVGKVPRIGYLSPGSGSPGPVAYYDEFQRGLRELGLWMIPPADLPHSFREFRPYLGLCRFSDCAHLSEPDCAIRSAVEAGEIDESRYSSYTKLRAEAAATWPRW